MNLSLVIVATVALLISCPCLLAFAVYSLADTYRTRQFGVFNSLLLNSFIFGLPASAVLGALLLWLAWFAHCGTSAYGLSLLPLVCLALYFGYLALLTRFVPVIAPDAPEF